MGYVVNRETLGVFTFEQAQALENAERTGLVLGFSDPGLEGTRWAMLDTGDMPLVDSRYYKLELSPVSVSEGKYSASWVQLPCDRNIDDMAADKLNDMRAECSNYIEAGFYSSALGSQHRYSSDRDAQTNMNTNGLAVLDGRDVMQYCYDGGGVRAKRPHTTAQFKQVCHDFGEHIWPKLDRFAAIREDIESARVAGDKEALIAISWA